jgi:hypothetical protein
LHEFWKPNDTTLLSVQKYAARATTYAILHELAKNASKDEKLRKALIAQEKDLKLLMEIEYDMATRAYKSPFRTSAEQRVYLSSYEAATEALRAVLSLKQPTPSK